MFTLWYGQVWGNFELNHEGKLGFLWFVLIRSVIGSENLRYFVNQLDSKLKQTTTCSFPFFPRFRQFSFFFFTYGSSWPPFHLFWFGCCKHNGFDITTNIVTGLNGLGQVKHYDYAYTQS